MSRGERWDRDRFLYERDVEREGARGRDRNKEVFAEDDTYVMRGGRGGRERSDERHDRGNSRGYDDDIYVSDSRYYADEPRYAPRREPAPEKDYDRRVVVEDREYYRNPSPRPTFLRRQSSLDTFDRRPVRQFWEREREELPPPARREDIYREDYRPPPYKPIPLPVTRGLPPPRRYDRDFYEQIDIAETDRYGGEEYRRYPERFREREFVKSRERRSRSRDSRTTRTRRSSSHSSTRISRSSRSSSSGGTTIRSEYPKKGKTRIPARLVSKRALIDLGYPFVEQSTTVIVQQALGQDNIDELLKLSEEYKKSEFEVTAARSSAGEAVEERQEEVFTRAPLAPPPFAPEIIQTAAPGEFIEKSTTVVREQSPARSMGHESVSGPVPIGPLAIAQRARSQSRSRREIRSEIRALERELVHRPKEVSDREIVRAERLPDGQLVMYEEEVEKVISRPKPPRIEKDKKGPPPKLVRAMLSTLT